MNEKQFKFSHDLALLVLYIYRCGYTVSFGDVWAKKGEGRPHSDNSDHYDRLAADLNLFKDGVFLKTTEAHRPFGEYWESLGHKWGGRFNDGNHYGY